MNSAAALSSLSADLERLQKLALGDLTAAVPSCPGWDLAKLIGHVGKIHRMALAVISTGALEPAHPSTLEPAPSDADGLRAYFADSAARLLHDLKTTSPDAPSWNFLGTPQVASFWTRRMAHEHAIHRYDAEHASGDTRPIPSDVSIDGIDEYFLIANIRVLPKKPDFSLGGSLHLHATDAEGEWMLTSTTTDIGANINVEHGHGKGDAAVRGTASDLLLGLWGRIDLQDTSRFEHFGDSTVIAAIATLGGN
jgi:uncharacterized protein (TIGR03083 family)